MDRRDEPRHRTRDDIPLAVGGRMLRCTVKNLSARGCLVESPGLIAEVGDPVQVTLMDEVLVTGEIAWQMGASTGIRFHQPVADAVVRWYALDDWPLRPTMPIVPPRLR